jgi:hypothetical protein
VIAVWIGLLLGVVGGPTVTPSAFPESVARRGCTQEDFPALEIYVTPRRFEGKGDPEAPYIRIEIAGREFQRLVGPPMVLSPLRRKDHDPAIPLVRAEWRASEKRTEFLDGTLTLESVVAERLVRGSYSFVSRDGARWTGAFKARWVQAPGGCG